MLMISRCGRRLASVHLTTARPSVATLQVAPAVADVRPAATVDIDRALKPTPPAVTAHGRQDRPLLPDVVAGLLVAAATSAALLSIAVLPCIILPAAVLSITVPPIRVLSVAILSVAVLPVVGSALVRPVLVLRVASIPILLKLDVQRGLCSGRHQSGGRRERTTQREQS